MKLPHSEKNFHNGEEFVYRSHRCRITYNGIRPHFNVDGRNAEDLIDDFEVTPKSVGRRGWRYDLMKAVDRMEGDDTESSAYIEPEERDKIRRRGREYIYDLAEAYGFEQAHIVLEESQYQGIPEIREEVTSRARNIMDREDAFGIEAFDRARNEVFKDILENVE